MPRPKPPDPKTMTTLRLSGEDRAYLDRLCSVTGLSSFADAIRLAVREAVNARGGLDATKRKKSRKF